MEIQIIQSKILMLRGQRVMLDFDLAQLYEVETRALKQSVRRNIRRFPIDFMFELAENEMREVVSQNVIPGIKYFGGAAPFAFTESGVAMLSTVLRSDKAIDVNISIMRAFIALRHFALLNADLAEKVGELETGLADINEVLRWLGEENQSRADEIDALQSSPAVWENRRPIGFQKE